ncbi:DEAD/DEAH box helicase/Helicase conserved C-terminal domain/Helicase associated domain (HA2), putative [Angomonas deanei]|uniref:RNA helicase n=1 Tax=Angomonas deanei TaxID=59799 RepID=A0A7G2C574_9TRYP|nr:DEAD/DEAH box helicase/Helicase conserved C-terminal domain/Helicase associated domain (HA2), putative [Angomonas deanei]
MRPTPEKRGRRNNLSLFRESEKTQLSGELLAKLQAKVTNSDYLERYAKRRQSLSISEKREEILSAIKESNVVIICGTTGCGKTTQVPQFILDKATEDGEGGECSILVTQPRRLSAVSIAQRVAAERLEDVGDTCGYAVRFDSKRGTSINFCTTGILMRTLHNDPMLSHINYLIIDEIHERDVNSDFLLILVREVLKTRTDLKVILMSATLQAKQFGDYFGNVPIINVEGYMFPVKELFLEDLATMASEEGISSPLLKQASAMADSMEEQKLTQDVTDWLEEDRKEMERKEGHAKYNILVADTEIDFVALQFAVQQAIKMADLSNSSILVFLPGWEEISRAKDILERDSRFDIVCLHSSISVHEQQRCFLPPEEGKIKLILSTNIAESGVTIDDVGAVIDLGRSKEKTFFARKGNTTSGKNVEGNVSQLLTVYASHANCVQRRGRVGRTRPGVCLRLYTKRHFDTLHQFQTPEILRTPLESLCLQVLALRLGEPRRFLNLALEPPEGDSTASAMSRLEYLGAVTTGGDLTPLGNTLSKLPVHPRWGKLVVMGVFFQALDATLTMASLADSDAFVTNREVREAVRLYREHFSCDSQSDYIANLNAYYFWIAARDKLPSAELTTTLGVRHISVPQLLLASRTKQQFYNILVGSKTIRGTIANSPDEQFNEAFVEQSAYSQESSSCNLIKSLLASCLFPDLCMSYGKQLLRSKTELHISPSRDSVVRKAKYDEEDQRFYVYAELSLSQETEKLLARNLSHSPFWALLLFTPPNVAVTHDLTTNIGVVDDWIPFHMKYADFELVKKFKTCLHYAIGTAMHQPLDILQREEFNTIRSLVKDLLNAPETTQADHVRQTGTIVSPSDALAQFLLSKKREDSEAAAETTETPTESETA